MSEHLPTGRCAVVPLRSLAEIDGPLYFYGSARLGQVLLEELDDRSRFRGFVDSYASGECLGQRVYSLSEFAAVCGPDAHVVITSAAVEPIAAALGELGITIAYDANSWWVDRQNALYEERQLARAYAGKCLYDGKPTALQDALDQTACWYFADRRYDDAMRICADMLQIDPNDATAAMNYGAAALRHFGALTAGSLEIPRSSTWCNEIVEYYRRLAAYTWMPRTQRLPANGKEPFVVTLTAFGEEFVGHLERMLLPTLLAEGNLPYWAERTNSMLFIATNASMVERIRSSPYLAAAAKFARVEVEGFPEDLLDQPISLKYQLASATHVRALMVADDNDAGIMFLNPDCLMSANWLRVVWQALEPEKEVIFAHHLAFVEDELWSALGDNVVRAPGDLLRLELPILPKIMSHNDYRNGGTMNHIPGELLWRLPDGGLIVYGYVHHPLVLRRSALRLWPGRFFHSNDSDFVGFIDPTRTKCTVIGGGEEGLNSCVTGAANAIIREFRNPPISDHKAIARLGADFSPVHRWQFTQQVVVTTLRRDEIDDALIQADAVARDITERIAQMEQPGVNEYNNGYLPFLNCRYQSNWVRDDL